MDLVDSARRYLGYHEGSGNDTIFGKWNGCNHAPWCHSFVSYNANQVGILNKLVPKTASTSVGMDWYIKKGRFGYKGQYTPVRNDLVYFKTGRSHVGIVEAVKNGMIYTVEGNSGDAVMTRHYYLDNATITGYGKVGMYMSSNGISANVQGNSELPTEIEKKTNKKGKTTKIYDATQELKILANYKKLSESSVVGKKVVGTGIAKRIVQHNVKIIVQQSKTKIFAIEALDKLKITYKQGSASTCEFTCFRHGIKFNSGNVVKVYVDNKLYWVGYIMQFQNNGERFIDITAYDQMVYLNNPDVVAFKGKTATEVLKHYAETEHLLLGTVAKTEYRHTEIFDGDSIYEIIDTFLSKDLVYKGKEYLLYDSVGKLILRNIKNLVYNGFELSIDTCEKYDYSEDLTNGFYNKVILYFENDKTGSYDLYKAQNDKLINRYGTFSTVEQIQVSKLGKPKADALLNFYSQVPRTLSANDCLGNIHVRDGTIIPVALDLENIHIHNYMIVSAATHTFEYGNFMMDLTLKGAGISDR